MRISKGNQKEETSWKDQRCIRDVEENIKNASSQNINDCD